MSGVEIALIASAVAGVATAGASLLRKSPTAVATPRPVTTNQARIDAEQRDTLAARTGTRANRRVGLGEGEAGNAAPKTSLLGRSA